MDLLIKNTKPKKIVVKGNTPGDMNKLYADNSRLQEIYDYKLKFTTLQIGIEKTCKYYLSPDILEDTNDGKITAVIPVRKGSTRCKNKNNRNFGNTNLLKLKIKTLKKIKGIEEIIVSTDCANMIRIATELNVQVHKRDMYYASSDCPNYKYWSHIAENVGKYNKLMIKLQKELFIYFSF